MIRYFLVVVGGGGGALARYVAASAIMRRFGGKFPLGTLAINVSGSFLIGFLMSMLTERLHADANWRLLLVVGFLGGYTTFSSFAWETYTTVREGGRWRGALNVVSSVILGYGAVWLGAMLAWR
ncbi:MAG TPA: fluoride efflux transporter CrcB [Candidatus Acidoferrales bacterium]|nr:fluoride efflux transporter CrcB [Candidatus Acidoferrales bacterium]